MGLEGTKCGKIAFQNNCLILEFQVYKVSFSLNGARRNTRASRLKL